MKDKEWLKAQVKDEECELKSVYDNYVPYENVLIADDVNDLIDQLDEPQAEKVEVNEEQARLLKKYENETLYSLISACSEKEEELLARARLCGYTFNPKRWVIRQGGSEVWYLQGFRNSLDGDIVKQWCIYRDCIKFTDLKKAEAVATLVEGSVEEA